MFAPPERHFPIAGTFNVRDLGGYDHAAGSTEWRRILRADGLHRLGSDGVDALKTLGVRTVIDLRRAEELADQPNPFQVETDVVYHNISLFDELAPADMTGENVLLDLYLRALDERGATIVEVLNAIADAADGIVLFHCTAGKDRTGLIAALILALAGVPNEIVVADYALTKKHIAPAIEGFIASALERGVDIEHFRPLLGCEPDTMVATLSHLSLRHGSAAAYLEAIGLKPETAARLKARLLEPV